MAFEQPPNGMEPSTATAIDIPATSDLTPEPEPGSQRKQKLRKAGAEYLERALQQSGKPDDLFGPSSSLASSTAAQDAQPQSKVYRPRKPKQMPEDPDMVAFGEVFESTKLYVYEVLYMVCQGGLVVLAKASLGSMKAPAVLSFLHMLAAVGSIWLAGHYEVFDLNPITLQALKGVAVRATIHGLQTLCIYSALLHSSVNMVLCWVALTTLVVDVGVAYVMSGTQPNTELKTAFAVAAGAGVLEFLFDGYKSWLSFLMLSCWTATKVAEWGWRFLKTDPTAAGRITDFTIINKIREISDEEDNLSSPNIALLQNAAAAVPVLLIGLLCLEGSEIIDHELSVPAVSMILVSTVAFVGTVIFQLLLDDKLDSATKQYLKSGSLLATVLINFVYQSHKVTTLTLAFTLITVITINGITLALKKRVMPAGSSGV